MNGALDGHSKAGVKVGNIGFQGIDVLADNLDLFHEKASVKLAKPTGVPKRRKPDVSLVGVVVVEVAFLETE